MKRKVRKATREELLAAWGLSPKKELTEQEKWLQSMRSRVVRTPHCGQVAALNMLQAVLEKRVVRVLKQGDFEKALGGEAG
jgi:hypothetical protein